MSWRSWIVQCSILRRWPGFAGWPTNTGASRAEKTKCSVPGAGRERRRHKGRHRKLGRELAGSSPRSQPCWGDTDVPQLVPLATKLAHSSNVSGAAHSLQVHPTASVCRCEKQASKNLSRKGRRWACKGAPPSPAAPAPTRGSAQPRAPRHARRGLGASVRDRARQGVAPPAS